MQRRKETSIVIGPVRMRTANQRKYRESFQMWVRFLYFVMASFGCVYWLFSMLELEVSMQKVFWHFWKQQAYGSFQHNQWRVFR